MDNDLISVIEVAKELGKRKQTIFKIIKKLGVEKIPQKNIQSKGQKIAYISFEDYERIKNYFSEGNINTDAPEIEVNASGVFYCIQLEPKHDPGRFKLGYATNLEERLRSHKTAAPFSKVLGSWPCKSLWEKTAIDSITQDCEKLHTEVFRSKSIDDVLLRCRQFFNLMPFKK